MGKEDFFNPGKQDKIKYINDKLSEGISLRQILNSPQFENEIMKSKKTLQKQFEKAGYFLNKENKEHNKNVRQVAIPENEESGRLVITGADIDKLSKILNFADEIIQMSEWWKKNISQIQTIDDRFDVPIPDDGEEIRKTIRINNKIWGNWKNFCKKHPGYSEKDLLAKALLWYIQKG